MQVILGQRCLRRGEEAERDAFQRAGRYACGLCQRGKNLGLAALLGNQRLQRFLIIQPSIVQVDVRDHAELQAFFQHVDNLLAQTDFPRQ